jgi:hypothetical protein
MNEQKEEEEACNCFLMRGQKVRISLDVRVTFTQPNNILLYSSFFLVEET